MAIHIIERVGADFVSAPSIVFDVAKRLQDYDPRVWVTFAEGEYWVLRHFMDGRDEVLFTVAPEAWGYNVIDEFLSGDARYGDPLGDMKKANEAADKAKDAIVEDAVAEIIDKVQYVEKNTI